MNPSDPYNSNSNHPAPEQEYHPKTIFSEPQAPVPPQAPINGAVFGATPLATELTAASQQKQSSTKKILIIGGAVTAAVALILIIVVVIVSGSGGNKKADDAGKQQRAAIIQPATDIEIEQINNSITQDMSGLDDEKDYPANSLENKTLGL